jgi:hypothetical protein
VADLEAVTVSDSGSLGKLLTPGSRTNPATEDNPHDLQYDRR